MVEEPTEPTEPVVEEPTEPEEPVVEVTYPAVDFEPVELDGLTVSVSAPEGALPEGTEMTATKIENMDAVQAAVDQMENMDVTALMAVDISFWHEGEEIELEEAVDEEQQKQKTVTDAIIMEDKVIGHVGDGTNMEPINKKEVVKRDDGYEEVTETYTTNTGTIHVITKKVKSDPEPSQVKSTTTQIKPVK